MNSPTTLAFVSGIVVGSAVGLALAHRWWASREKTTSIAPGAEYSVVDTPDWCRPLFTDSSYTRVVLREWEDMEWRKASGWKGNDLCHNPTSNAVRVLAYFWNKAESRLVGIVHFGPNAESHRGLCHGGAMTSVFDDVLGHIAFVDGRPWHGATVQVNCTLKRPVNVGDVLQVSARITERKGRKVMVYGELVGEDPADSLYATMEGVSISGVTLPGTPVDEVSRREWIRPSPRPDSDGEDTAAPKVSRVGAVEWHLRDSGWQSPLGQDRL